MRLLIVARDDLAALSVAHAHVHAHAHAHVHAHAHAHGHGHGHGHGYGHGHGHGHAHADLAALSVVDGADLEAVFVAAQQARLAAAITRRARGHHGGLAEDARTTVVAAREGHRILVVVRQVEVAREPALDARVLADDLDELLGHLSVVVVEPAAAVDHVALLQHAQPRADDRRVREAEDLPPLRGGVVLDRLLKPSDLLIVHHHLVGRVLGRAEGGLKI